MFGKEILEFVKTFNVFREREREKEREFFFYFFYFYKLRKKQSLVTKLVVVLGYNFTQYLFIGSEF